MDIQVLSNIPKYQMVKMELINRINNGEFSDDNMLPSENQIGEEYHVSRVTVRKAFEEMEKEALVYRVQGKGTFLKNPAKARFQNQLVKKDGGFTYAISIQGFRARSETIRKVIEPCSAEIAHELNLSPGTEILVYERNYYADDIPAIYAISYIDHQLLPHIEWYDFNFIPYSHVLNNYTAMKYFKSERKYLATRAIDVAERLGLLHDEPILLSTHKLFIDKGQDFVPMDFTVAYVRSDLKGFSLEF
jgi:GntR family transcriptional regulator